MIRRPVADDSPWITPLWYHQGATNRHRVLTHVPISATVAAGRKHVDPSGELWTAVLATTSQPDW